MARNRRILQVVSCYLALLDDLTQPRVTEGIVRLYGDRMGCGSLHDPLPELRKLLEATLGPARFEKDLVAYAQSCLAYNARCYAILLRDLLRQRITAGPGNAEPTHPEKYASAGAAVNNASTYRRPGPATVKAIRDLKHLMERHNRNSPADGDIIRDLARMCALDAEAHHDGCPTADEDVLDFLRLIDPVYREHMDGYVERYHTPMLRSLFSLTCLYHGVLPSDLRRFRPVGPMPDTPISDLTLAALPFPMLEHLKRYEEPAAARLSRKGADYLAALARFASETPM